VEWLIAIEEPAGGMVDIHSGGPAKSPSNIAKEDGDAAQWRDRDILTSVRHEGYRCQLRGIRDSLIGRNNHCDREMK
jgi:hypothetical protein